MAKWRQTIGLVCLAALPGAISQAYAFGLGHASVQSALGQPLRAEIDITQITPDEASSLKVGIAPASAFESRNLNYNSIMPDVTVSLERRPDGQPYLRISSTHPVRDPFIDVLLRAYWANGELTRDYTLLFDPPNFQEPQAATSVAPQAPAVAQSASSPTGSTEPPQAQQNSASTKSVAPPQAAASSASAPARQAKVQASEGVGRTYKVRPGDTLSSIAHNLGLETVSLDQMLAAIYRANSGAFIDHNMNLVRAGAILQIPSAQTINSISPREARQVIVAQSRSFEAYRRRLAEMTDKAKPGAQTDGREAKGKIQAEVQEPVGSSSAPKSQLKLGQARVGAAQGQAAEADRIASQQQAAATASALSTAKANVAALSKLAASASAAVQAASAGSAGAKPAATVSAAAPNVAAPVSSPSAAASAQPAAAAASVAALVPAAVAPSKPRAINSHPVPPGVHKDAGPSWFSSLLANPMLAPAAGVIALLLAAAALMRRRRRKKDRSQRDASVFDSRLSAADSFFGGSGGERVDTRNSTLGSSVGYTASQLDAGDVDPIAEADVYLAYGRDLQAEEILKESLKDHPERNAVRLKLLEIYAKRKDVRSFEMTAAELFSRTEGTGPEWKKAQDLGRNLDPINPLYHNTVPPSTVGAPTTIPATDFAATGVSMLPPAQTLAATEFLTAVAPAPMEVNEPHKAQDDALDLDLDLAAASAVPKGAVMEAARAPSAASASALHANAQMMAGPDSVLNFDLGDFQVSRPPSASPAETKATPGPSREPLEFDFGSLALEAPTNAPAAASTSPSGALDSALSAAPQVPTAGSGLDAPDSSQGLDTRLALVDECRALGDLDMARNLLGEIIAESSGEAKARAEKQLAELS